MSQHFMNSLVAKALAIFCVLFVLVMSLSAKAAPANNPQIRACRLTGGTVQILKISLREDEPNDQFVFCKYSKLALVDGLSIRLHLAEEPTLALDAYKQNIDSDKNTCVANEGRIVSAKNLEDKSFSVCLFVDHSMIELLTLTSGINAPINKNLNQALGFN